MLDVNIRLTRPSQRKIEQSSQFLLDAEFKVSAGQCLGVMGASGAGKTSLLHAVAGLSLPEQGFIQMDGHVWFNSANRIHLPPHQRRVGIVFQDGRLFPHLNVARNLKYGMTLNRTNSISFDDIVDVLAINALLQRHPSQLSGGEKQRVAIGRALLSQPTVLLFDEPVSGLDMSLKDQVLTYIKRVIDMFGLPAIYVSHVLNEITAVSTEVLTLTQDQLRQPKRECR